MIEEEDIIEGEKILLLIESLLQDIENEYNIRWNEYKKKLSNNEICEVIGALLARQTSLTLNFVEIPMIWNHHIAPLILRAMTDVYISLAWILEQPQERSQRFIRYGLGEYKLQIEHRKKQAERDGKKAEDDPLIPIMEDWINSQRYIFLTEVDTGSWSGISTRKMAEEAGCIDFYNYVYRPFSSAVHSMWCHIARFNTKNCKNPLHGFHKIPTLNLDDRIYIFELRNAVKYLNKTFLKLDEKLNIIINVPSSFEKLEIFINNDVLLKDKGSSPFIYND